MNNRNQVRIATIIGVAVIMLVIGVAIGSVAFPMTKTDTPTKVVTQSATAQTTTQTVSTILIHTSSAEVLVFSECNNVMNINGTQYCALDVSSEIVLQIPGYAYLNSANEILFNGVSFKIICESNYQGCPNNNPNATVTAVMAGAISFNLIFPDKINETLGNVLPDWGNLTLLSSHTNPRAGMQIEYVPPSPTMSYPENGSGFIRTFLLVQQSPSEKTGSVALLGSCAATTFVLPDTVEVILTNVTTITNSVATYYVSAYSAINPIVETLGTTTYMTTTYAFVAVSYVVIGTSVDSNVLPSSLWVVSVCTFAPSS